MLTADQRDLAARHLLAARRARQPGPRIPESCRPVELEDALAVQRRVQELLGAATGGWKCSLPTEERAVSCAAIFAPTIARSSPCTVVARAAKVRIEPEIAFVLGSDVPPGKRVYDEEELSLAIAETRLVLEILDSRYANPAEVAFAELLADQVSNQGLFVGPVLPDGLHRQLDAFPIAIDGPDGRLHAREGRHPDSHPLWPFVWLANFITSRGGWLRTGQIVTTGSYAGALEVPVATPIAVTFGDLGSIQVEFTAAA